ncbi:hypothetical protein AXG93_1520s1140 [Marchantia polymorpha subsp. ruderalis]|nr:hypothetical protein AXG93_1520s1140 [Marchantia polymorpha subsp. ruderalis]
MIGHRVSCAPFVHAREAFGIEKGRVVGVGVRAAAAAAAGGKEGEVSRSSEISIGSGSSGEFVKSLADLYPRLPCRHCKGLAEVSCDKCTGEGKLAKGGWHKKNPVDLDRIIGSKWTAMESTFGWRHFRVHSKRRGSGKDWFVEMSATCDESTRFWVNVKNLKERERWSMGWLQKREIIADKDTAFKLSCKACKGTGRLPCICTLHNPEELSLEIIEV